MPQTSPEPATRRLLNVPALASAHFSRNLIVRAVCELRFPTLFEFDDVTPPRAFANALRKEYPNYETLMLQPGDVGVMPVRAHAFRSKKQKWTATIRAAAVTLETDHYSSFEEFHVRLSSIVAAASQVIDSDMFTRVGIRYINHLPCSAGEIGKWISPRLTGSAVGAGDLGDVEEYTQIVRGPTEVGGFFMRHGVLQLGAGRGEAASQAYLLDFDMYSEDVAASRVLDVVKDLHALEFNLFMWSLGPAAQEYLGTSTLGKGSER